MEDGIRKAPFRCPSCQFVQLEPAHLVSTYCRSCGSHYAVRQERRADARPPGRRGGILSKMLRKVLAKPPREILCYQCGQSHEVSGYAHSTICPGCSEFIELTNITCSANTSRPVDTRGHLHIESGAYLNNAFIVCGSAHIEGRISGNLRSEGEVRLGLTGRCACVIHAESVVVDKVTNAHFVYPIQTKSLIVHGHLEANVRCAGMVHIARGGSLQGHIEAHSLAVDRGGSLRTESIIQQEKDEVPPCANPESQEDSSLSGEAPAIYCLGIFAPGSPSRSS